MRKSFCRALLFVALGVSPVLAENRIEEDELDHVESDSELSEPNTEVQRRVYRYRKCESGKCGDGRSSEIQIRRRRSYRRQADSFDTRLGAEGTPNIPGAAGTPNIPGAGSTLEAPGRLR